MAASRRFSLGCVIAAMFVVNMVYSLSLPLLAVRLDAMGISETVIGLNTAIQPLAGILIAPFFPRLIRLCGARWILAVALLSLCIAFVLFPIWESLVGWFVLRAVTGAAACALWAVSEAWIHSLAEDHNRGRVIGIYATAGTAGVAIGPLILALTGTVGVMPFLLGAMLCLACLFPVIMAEASSLSMEDEGSGSLWACLLFAPLPMVLSLVMSASFEAIHAFLPLVPGQASVQEVFLLLGLLGVGGMTTQYLVGWLADKVNRVRLVLALAAGEFLFILGIPYFLAATPGGIAYFLAWGAVGSGLHGLGVLLVGHYFRGAALAAGSATFAAMYNFGVLVGPTSAGVLVDIWQGDGLVLSLACFTLLILPAAAWTVIRTRKPIEKLV